MGCAVESGDKQNKIGGRDRWEVESDLRALRDADKISRSKDRLKSVKLLVKEELGALKKIAGEKKAGLGVED